MTVRQVLKEALAIVQRAHTSTQLAVDKHGQKVTPIDEHAVAWSSTGALIKVAPSGFTAPLLQHRPEAGTAYELLEQAASQQGYPNVASVDAAGASAAVQMFWRALQVCPDDERPRRRRESSGANVGSNPKGAA